MKNVSELSGDFLDFLGRFRAARKIVGSLFHEDYEDLVWKKPEIPEETMRELEEVVWQKVDRRKEYRSFVMRIVKKSLQEVLEACLPNAGQNNLEIFLIQNMDEIIEEACYLTIQKIYCRTESPRPSAAPILF